MERTGRGAVTCCGCLPISGYLGCGELSKEPGTDASLRGKRTPEMAVVL